MIKLFEKFKPSENRLRDEAYQVALERFNIIHSDDVPYIVYNGVIVSTKEDGDVLVRLKKLRDMFIENYVNEKLKAWENH